MEGECPVCLEKMASTIGAVFPCAHATCLACLASLSKPARCPLCRLNLAPHLPPAPLNTLAVPVRSEEEPSRTISIVFSRLRNMGRRGSPSSVAPRFESSFIDIEVGEDEATVTERPVLETDLQNARVTRNSIYFRDP